MKSYNDIVYNEYEYSEQKTYITLGINVGVCTKYFLINRKEVFYCNLAFANILASYIKKISDINLKINVDRTISTYTYILDNQTKKISEAMITVLRNIFEIQPDKEIFENVKKESIDRFKKVYKNGEFRGFYKAFEYADLNKEFKLLELVQGLEQITFEEFYECYSKVCVPDNACLYVNGALCDIDDEVVLEINEILNKFSDTAVLVGRIKDPHLKEDAHLLEISRENCNIDILSFGFESRVSTLDKLMYVVIETDKVPYTDKTLHIDEFDSSLIVNQGELMKLKNYFKRMCTEEQFLQAREGILGKYNEWLEKNPIRFNDLVCELMLNGISILDYLSILENVEYKNYKDIVEKIKPIVSEAQIVMRR